ncbi:MAG: hypothetical protein DRN30_05115 [Thermoplasmata archaeon]|nr:hypothetical protein [Euryarchaeota archaeon]RLF64745.1 MAG: hypothetical protein DRN30_05115 [Thermoplasmata archaeon]
MIETCNLEEFTRELMSKFEKDTKVVLIMVKNPHEIEKAITKVLGKKIYHFWEPSSPYGLMIIENVGKIAWILGDQYKIIKTFKLEESLVGENIGDILSSASYKDNVLRIFKEKY